MVRFLHTSDWQIGMTRHFLDGEAQARFSAARVDVIGRLARVAVDQGCDFIVVCGDVFESNQLTVQTVRRALEALRHVPVPVYLLPGNHDPLDAMSIFTSDVFRDEAPDQVHVLDRPGVHEVAPGVELVAAPWHGKHPDRDLVAEVVDGLPAGPAPEGTVRVVVGHGAVDVLDPDRHNRAAIATAPLVEALEQGRIHYVALGDRHSRTQVADAAIHYSGAPEPTAARERRPGDVLVVEVEPGEAVRVTPHHVGTWAFDVLREQVGSDADLDWLDGRLASLPDKDRTVLHYALRGTLTVAQHARLESILARHGDTLAALVEWSRHHDVAIVSDEEEWAELGLGGFLGTAVDEIRGLVEVGAAPAPVVEEVAVDHSSEEEGLEGLADEDPLVDDDGLAARAPFVPDRDDDEESARDALALLYRLTRGGAA